MKLQKNTTVLALALVMMLAININVSHGLRTTCGGEKDQDGDRTWPQKLPGKFVHNWDELSSEFGKAKDKHVFVLFFYSWCKSCMKDYPVFEESWGEALKKYKNDVVFLKVDLDEKGDLFKYFKIQHSPTFAYLGKGGVGNTIYYNKYSGKLDVSKLLNFVNNSCDKK